MKKLLSIKLFPKYVTLKRTRGRSNRPKFLFSIDQSDLLWSVLMKVVITHESVLLAS